MLNTDRPLFFGFRNVLDCQMPWLRTAIRNLRGNEGQTRLLLELQIGIPNWQSTDCASNPTAARCPSAAQPAQ